MMSERDIVSRNWRKMTPILALAALVTSGFGDELQELWSIPALPPEDPNHRVYMTTGNTERGLAYNPVTGHVLLATRNGTTGTAIMILDGETGAELGQLTMDGVGGGLFPINLVKAADDGVIYAVNLVLNTGASQFTVYRWENENPETFPTIAFIGDPAGLDELGLSLNAQRWGDTLDVRGAGENTQVLVGANAGPVVAVLTTEDGLNFTSTLVDNASVAGSLGVAFGEGDTFWTKKNAQALRHVGFDLSTGTGTDLGSFSGTDFPATVTAIDVNTSSNWLGGVSVSTTVQDYFALYDIAGLPEPPVIVDQEDFSLDNANLNNVGAVSMHEDLVFVLDTNNELVAYRVVPSVNPPEITTQPTAVTILEGGYGSLSVSAIGSQPLSYQWMLGGNDIAGATEASLTFTDISADDAGTYTVRISNSAGSVTSSEVAVTVEPTVRSNRATELWSLSPGERTYITDANTERTVAYNKATGHVLLVSRTGPSDVHVLDGETGEFLWTMQTPTSMVTGGTFRMNVIGVADDGVVFVANLDTGGSAFTIYRWDNDSATSEPVIAYLNSGEISGRHGDTIDVRGSGTDTQILTGLNLISEDPPAVFEVFTTTDGVNFFPTVFNVAEAPAGSTRLTVAFGAGDTVWTKSSGQPLRQFAFDLTAGTATLARTYTSLPNAVSVIGVHASSNLLAGIGLETPDNVRLYDISNLEEEPVLIDQDFFPTDNANVNGTGAVVFSDDVIYTLDSNNGILALQLNADVGGEPEPADLGNIAIEGENFTFTISGSPNQQYRAEGTADFETWTEVDTVTTDAEGSADITDAASANYRFYRVVAVE